MASEAELTRCVMIRGGNLGNRPWIVTNVQTIEGVEMICLNKMDAGLQGLCQDIGGGSCPE